MGIPGEGAVSTNYLDVGGATNSPARYYRIEVMVPSPGDNAVDPAYSSGWATATMAERGFGPWTLTGSAVLGGSSNGFFIGSSTNNAAGASPGIDVNGKSWGIYANNGNFTAAYRSFANGPLQVGQSFKIDIDNGFINSNQTVGLTIRNGNATGSFTNYNTGSRFEFLCILAILRATAIRWWILTWSAITSACHSRGPACIWSSRWARTTRTR